MDNGQLNWVASFIWGIADDVLRDVYREMPGEEDDAEAAMEAVDAQE